MAITVEDLYKQKSEIDNIKFECSEAHERLKIARGYYASFLNASALFDFIDENGKKLALYEKFPGSSIGYGSHQKIYMSLQLSRVRNLVELGLSLQKYHKLRKKADYDLGLKITDDDANDAQIYLKDCKERIGFYIANGSQHFTKSKKVVNATKNSSGKLLVKGLTVLK